VGWRKAVAGRLPQHAYGIPAALVHPVAGDPDEIGIGGIELDERLGDFLLGKELVADEASDRFAEGRTRRRLVERSRLADRGKRREIDALQRGSLVVVVGGSADLGDRDGLAGHRTGGLLAAPDIVVAALDPVGLAAPEKEFEKGLGLRLRRPDGYRSRQRNGEKKNVPRKEFHR